MNKDAIACAQKSSFEHFILVLFAGYLFIDSLNGFLVSQLGLPSILSVIYKQTLLGCLVLYALRYSPISVLWLSFIFFGLFVWGVFRFYLIDNIGFIHSFQEAVKVIYFFVILLVMSEFKTLTEQTVKRIMLVFVVVLCLNVFASLVGLGASTYGSFGAKGFFYGGNAISGIIILLSSYFLSSAFKHSFSRFLFYSFLFILLSVLVGTKSGILGVLFVSALVVLLNLNTKVLIGGLCGLAALVVVIFNLYEFVISNPLYLRMQFFYDEGGISRLLFSGREEKFQHIIPTFINGDVSQLLLGFNYFQLHRLASTLTEFDVVDMFVLFGALFSFVVFIFYGIVFIKLTCLPSSVLSQSACISFVVLTFIALIAGHVFFNGVVTPLWGLVCAAAYAGAKRSYYLKEV